MKKRFTEEQVVNILRLADADWMVIRDLCRKHNITEQTIFHWRNKYGGMTFSEVTLSLNSVFLNAFIKRHFSTVPQASFSQTASG